MANKFFRWLSTPVRKAADTFDAHPPARMIKRITRESEARLDGDQMVLVDKTSDAVLVEYEVNVRELGDLKPLAVYARGYNAALSDVSNWKRSTIRDMFKIRNEARKEEPKKVDAVQEQTAEAVAPKQEKPKTEKPANGTSVTPPILQSALGQATESQAVVPA